MNSQVTFKLNVLVINNTDVVSYNNSCGLFHDVIKIRKSKKWWYIPDIQSWQIFPGVSALQGAMCDPEHISSFPRILDLSVSPGCRERDTGWGCLPSCWVFLSEFSLTGGRTDKWRNGDVMSRGCNASTWNLHQGQEARDSHPMLV